MMMIITMKVGEDEDEDEDDDEDDDGSLTGNA